jgi:manganese-dependent inorganic pyrophosphatase
MTREVVTADPEDPVLAAGRVMQERSIRSLPVVDGGTVVGLVTTSILARRYVGDLAVRGFSERPVKAGRLAQVLGARVAAGDPDTVLEGDVLVGAMEPETMRTYISAGDTIIVGDRRRTQPMALEAGAACLISTGGYEPAPEVLESAERVGAVVLVTEQDTYGAARLLNLSDPVSGVMERHVVRCAPDDLLSEISEDLFASAHREAVVEDGAGALAGLITRTSIATAEPRRVILVDHNEVAQSAPGIEDASVVEIVDHHRVGDVQTAGPVLFLNLPVGATATIVAERYRELDVEPPESMAGIMLGALLSDTVLLKSPTTTRTDRRVAERLAATLEVDVVEFGMEMFRARSSGATFSAHRAVTADLKEYRLGGSVIAIGQVETVDLEQVLEHRDELLSVMQELHDARGLDVVLLMITDVVREGTELLAVGRTRAVERAFGVRLGEHSAWLEGVLSRKKQVAPRLAESIGG